MRRLLALGAVLAVLGSGCTPGGPPPADIIPSPSIPSPSSPSPPSPGPPAVRPQDFSAVRAFRHVRALASEIGPRPAGSDAYRRSVAYVARRFRALGYRTRVDAFRVSDGVVSWNVVASSRRPSWPALVIGAHLDTVPESPGGNDNASGVAVVLELARVLARSPEAPPVRLVAFGAEEAQPDGSHHVGSAAYVAAFPRPAERLAGMVSVDMLGLARPLVVAWLGMGSPTVVRRLLAAARREGAPAEGRITPDWSDNGPFEKAGVPAAFLWTGDEPNHHRPTDVAENVSRTALRRAGRVLVRFSVPWARRLAG